MLGIDGKYPDFICSNESPLKMMIFVFYFIKKLFLFLRYLNFCPDYLGHAGKQLDKKAKIDFKINFINWETNSYSTHM